jgi:hypothetical protein
VVAALLAEHLVDGLGVLVAYVRKLGGSLQFDQFIVDHVQEIVSLLVADTGISSLLTIDIGCDGLLCYWGLGLVFDFTKKGIGSGIVDSDLNHLLPLVLVNTCGNI